MQIKYKRKQHSGQSPQQHAPRKRGLLKDLFEIKAVLDVEAQLTKALLKMAVARQAVGLRLSY